MKSEFLPYGGYLLDFRLSEADLAGKTILDLGAGARELAFDSLENGVGRVISLDIDSANWRQLKSWTDRQLTRDSNHPVALSWQALDRTSLGASATHLPFADQQFDLILSRSVVPLMLENAAAVESAVSEIIRVLKVGGQALFYPFIMEHWKPEEITTSQTILDLLQSQTNLELTLEEIIFRGTGRPGLMLKITKLH